jgi:predicted phosphodiesterase
MDRRIFLKQTYGVISFFACPNILLTPNKTKVKFGLVTDIHYANRQTKGSRYYKHSIAKLTDAITIFNKKNLDLLIELGDLKDEGNPPEKHETITFLIEIENILNNFDGPIYHVLGNHDMDSISKKDFLNHITNYDQYISKNYYSFILNEIKFIVLDANFNQDGSDYNAGNFDWTYSLIPEHQKYWLQNELKDNNLPVIIFIHQLLDAFSGVSKLVCVNNADEIVKIIENNNNVLAVFQGHHHEGNYSFRNGIHYFTMKAMVEGSLPDNNSFAIIEIDEDLNIIIDGFYNCKDKFLGKIR